MVFQRAGVVFYAVRKAGVLQQHQAACTCFCL